jgi:hypothetical protein
MLYEDMDELINGGFMRHKIVVSFVVSILLQPFQSENQDNSCQGSTVVNQNFVVILSRQSHVCTNTWLGQQGTYQHLEFLTT